MSVADQINQFLSRHNIQLNDPVVLACSTGVDSMVLLDLFLKQGQKLVVAHVNHGMRKASTHEEDFCKSFCESNNIVSEILHLDPETDMPSGMNFQQWAREQRYAFFHQISVKHDCKYIATAHHATDKAETFFMNAIRGSGTSGLSSLKEKNGSVIRPLLQLNKDQIITYARENELEWFEDESNQSDSYQRNRIRHYVLPALKNVDENWQKGFDNTANALEADNALIQSLVSGWASRNVRHENNEIHISLSALAEQNAKESLLWHLLRNTDPSLPISSLANSITDQTGSTYMGKTHVALKDRDWLIIKRQGEKEDQNEVIVHPEDEMINRPRQISLEKRNKPNGFSISNMNLDNSTALLDFDKLSFPLKIRKWQPGDKFRPLGMKGFKKISDFLIDEKISRFEKENTHVMLSNDEIIWVVGHRIDDRFKVGKDTQIMYLGRLHNPRV